MEKVCGKCEGEITDKNVTAVNGIVQHKICPKKEDKKSKEKVAKKEKISAVRVTNAEKLIEFLSELNIAETEMRKVMSRAYGIISKRLK